MEIAEIGVGELVKISEKVLEEAASAVGFAVCRAIEPAEEVCRTIVEGIIDEMVHLPDVGITVPVDEDRSWTIESERHEDVAGFVAEIAHVRRIVPSPFLFGTHGRSIHVQDFVSLCCKKIAVGMSPEDFAADKLRWDLVATFG